MTGPGVGVADRVARSGGAIFAEVDDEVVALDVARGLCYGFNGVASRVWDLIDPPATVGEVCDALLARYAVDRATCESQVIDLIVELRAEGLVVIQPSGPPA